MPKFNKATPAKLKQRMSENKKYEMRKLERLRYERNLQSNLDQYVTRAVTELVYRVPEDTAPEESRRQGSIRTGEDANEHPTRLAQGNTLHPPLVSDGIARERFPIPIEVRYLITTH